MSGVYGYIGENEVYGYYMVGRMVMDQMFFGYGGKFKNIQGGSGGCSIRRCGIPPREVALPAATLEGWIGPLIKNEEGNGVTH